MVKDTFFEKKRLIQVNGKIIDLSTPIVAGILNITPDSFYDGGNYFSKERLTFQYSRLIHEGADIVDIGAYSSRPGAENISVEKEKERLCMALDAIREMDSDTIISIDTFRARVARMMIEEYNVGLINDISSGEADPEILDIAANYNVPYIAMHMKGTPQTMQKLTHYNNVVDDIVDYFAHKVYSLKERGIKDIFIDPGFGFGKTIEQNFELLANLDVFKIFKLPIMVGISRKSMIYRSLNIDVKQALNGTSILHTIALQNGANIIRAHDVKEAKEAINLYQKVLKAKC